jgi:lipid-A-disaccharide synthase
LKPFKFFIIAGEASGDLHASNLMKALRKKDAHVSFVGLGGDKMRAEGCDIRVDYREMAYMGVLAVLSNLDKVRRNFRIAKQTLLEEKPDALILIDYPSFNLKIAKFCKNHLPNTKVIYYIPPKIWAWKKWRVHSIAKYCDEILGIFPFEPAFYAKYGYKCHYVGNPTADCIREFTATSPTSYDRPTIAILPGSRRSEISHCLPIMLEAARKVAGEQYHIIVTAAPGIEDAFYQSFLLHNETLTRDTYNIVAHAQAAVVNSGTATLETALIGCPQTAVYHVAGSKYLEKLLRPILFRIPHFTLVNIIPNQEIIQELIASRFTTENVAHELHRLLYDQEYRTNMLTRYQQLHTILGNASAANNAADKIYTLILNCNETNH